MVDIEMGLLNMTFNSMKRCDYEKLPHRNWNHETNYSSVVIVKSKYKHDSGYAIMLVIGCNSDGIPFEIAASCPDYLQIKTKGEFQVDCSYSCGAIRFYSFTRQNFYVGCALSSLTIEIK